MGGGGYEGSTYHSNGGGISSGAGGARSLDDDSDLKKSCPLLTFPTPLNSVNSEELAKLSEGSILTIEERDGIVVAVGPDGGIVGSITAAQLANLLACMAAGYEYIGVVNRIDGGSCLVTIKHRKK